MDDYEREREKEIRQVFEDLGLPDIGPDPKLGHVRAWSRIEPKQEKVFFEYDTNTARLEGGDDAELE